MLSVYPICLCSLCFCPVHFHFAAISSFESCSSPLLPCRYNLKETRINDSCLLSLNGLLSSQNLPESKLSLRLCPPRSILFLYSIPTQCIIGFRNLSLQSCSLRLDSRRLLIETPSTASTYRLVFSKFSIDALLLPFPSPSLSQRKQSTEWLQNSSPQR